MGEKQEKVWVVMRQYPLSGTIGKPVKVFDDRQDARSFAKRHDARATKYVYSVIGVLKG